jgi:hypothetical protein
MYLDQLARERAADHTRQLEDEAVRSRLAAEARSRRTGGIGFGDRVVVRSCRALRLDDVGAGRGRAAGLLVSPLVWLEESCTDRLRRAAPACC